MLCFYKTNKYLTLTKALLRKKYNQKFFRIEWFIKSHFYKQELILLQ
jgi:hypothetical protein